MAVGSSAVVASRGRFLGVGSQVAQQDIGAWIFDFKIGALMIRIGFGGPLYGNYNKDPPHTPKKKKNIYIYIYIYILEIV